MDQFKRSLKLKKKMDQEYLKLKGCLTDTLVNKYMDLITKHSSNKLYAFNTYFFSTLYLYGFSRIHRWTKNIDIFSKKRLFIPVYFKSKTMWSLIYVNFKDKSIRFYDSHGNPGLKYQRLILKYLKLEYLMKTGKFFSSTGWRYTNLNCLDDGFKCWDSGLFLCFVTNHFAQNLSRDASLSISPETVGGERRVREKIENELMDNRVRFCGENFKN
ncbi:sentrin-specific protease 1-like [Metopolophium dirhodum]|uniref:sentrin-specific protease 1-like n=1 Tax=Metopolophium dirhodum TaxID=44670 RepID=UPI00298FD04D|nr:sentrin-specific protease 1-like [Metopolophium dirhodum]XP_060879465.1 sentrin-specific protease 1-like [Metopolophium dirhodum]XP_060879466.1 sentrin-specific protease 1-like [Metopolophium dirhodum]